MTFYFLPIDATEKIAPLIEREKILSYIAYLPQVLRFVEADSFKTSNLSSLKMIQSAGGKMTTSMYSQG